MEQWAEQNFMTTQSKSCLGLRMLPCEQYLDKIHLYSYRGSLYNCAATSHIQGLCLPLAGANGWVGAALWVNPSTDLNTASLLHHCQTGIADWKFIILWWPQCRRDGTHHGDLFWKNAMCTNLVRDPLTPSCLSRFDNTCNLAQTLSGKKLCQSSKLQHSLHWEGANVFKPCALQVSSLHNSAHGVCEDWGHTWAFINCRWQHCYGSGRFSFQFSGEKLCFAFTFTLCQFMLMFSWSPPPLRLIKTVAQQL